MVSCGLADARAPGTYVSRRVQRTDNLRMHIRGLQGPAQKHRQGLVGGGENLESRDDLERAAAPQMSAAARVRGLNLVAQRPGAGETHGGGVDEGILEFEIPGEQLRLQEVGVGHVAEEGSADDVGRRDVLETDCFDSHGAAVGART